MTEHLKNPTVNRYLEDKTFDNIDHALGRPFNPLAETYRNHYALMCLECPQAKAFQASPYWRQGYSGSGTTYFHVTKAGRQALAEHLREIGDPHKLFHVTFDGYESVVVAETAAKARYSDYLKASDCWSELTFREFCSRSTVRRMRQAEAA